MKEKHDLTEADLASLLTGRAAAPSGLSAAPPGRRFFVRLVILATVFVLAWFLIGQPMLAPLAERVRVHTATTRVESHREEILAAATRLDMDPNLIAAIVFAESSGRVDARSKADALGLMQLKLATAGDRARQLGLPEPTEADLLTDPALNILLGSAHIQWAIQHEDGHLERALVGYNAGRGRLRQWVEAAGSYEAWREERVEAGTSQTLAYATKVLAQRDAFAEAGLFAPAPLVPPTDGFAPPPSTTTP